MSALKIKHGFLASVMLAFLTLSGYSHAYTIDVDTDVGDQDTFIASTLLENSGDATEIAWMEGAIYDVLGLEVDLTIVDKVDYDEATIADFILQTNEDESVYAIEIDPTIDYYVIKTGNGTDPTLDTYLFANVESLLYAVFDLGTINVTEILTISHITATTSAVPIPAAAWLFGSALLGMIGIARRKTTA